MVRVSGWHIPSGNHDGSVPAASEEVSSFLTILWLKCFPGWHSWEKIDFQPVFLWSAGEVVFHKLFCGLLAQEPVCFSLFSLSGRFTVWSTERRVISSNPCTVPLLLETWFGVETNDIHEHHFGSAFEYLAHKWDKNIYNKNIRVGFIHVLYFFLFFFITCDV